MCLLLVQTSWNDIYHIVILSKLKIVHSPITMFRDCDTQITWVNHETLLWVSVNELGWVYSNIESSFYLFIPLRRYLEYIKVIALV
jgi:hypothetical protein